MKVFTWTCVLAVTLALAAPPCLAEVFIYRGPNGERMISDRPPSAHEQDYELLTQRDSLDKAGHILARRRVDTGNLADFRHYITSACERHDIDPDLVEAIIYVESGFNPEAVSRKGATGLMQLMWPTAQQYNVRDRFDPRENINAGVEHIKDLMERFDREIPLVLAAYNAGAGAVERYRDIPPYAETQRYVAKVMAYRARLKTLYVTETGR